MHQLAIFHQKVSSLFNHIGLEPIEKTSKQEAFSLTIDNNFRFYLGLINQFDWYIFTDLGHINELTQKNITLLSLLHFNNLTQLRWQPVAALNQEQHLILWVRLPLYEINEYELVDIFELLLEKSEQCVAEKIIV
ncbi:CesT family type III secretion system chaperone [Arsenophonus nasoniae]|uniref:CesT family type III secretion system chaperone n=1 Tax=Arsenophonus nasoniae TaxID=638 RepID=A0AA95GU33_9GAMM|nr:CesT family type III secretion system chaperone [Arsenophonus nasoniae]WGM01240.1 CesT family type III secretion system chaperone [Arsenophonus nasoniae]